MVTGNRASPSAVLTCQPRSRKLTYSSCFLQACLWSLLLFSAWTRRRRRKPRRREKHTCSNPFGSAVGKHWIQGLKGRGGSQATLGPVNLQGHPCPLVEAPSPTQTYSASRPLCLRGHQDAVHLSTVEVQSQGWGGKPERSHSPQLPAVTAEFLQGARTVCLCYPGYNCSICAKDGTP